MPIISADMDCRVPSTSLDASADCRQLIKAFESWSARRYRCPTGHWTIGWGHVILTHEGHLWHRAITVEEGEALLRGDIVLAERGVDAHVRQPLKQCEFDALVSFVFNAGPGVADGQPGDFADSTMVRKLNAGDIVGAGAEFSKWVYGRVGGKMQKLRGLVRRRAAERAMFSGDPDWAKHL